MAKRPDLAVVAIPGLWFIGAQSAGNVLQVFVRQRLLVALLPSDHDVDLILHV